MKPHVLMYSTRICPYCVAADRLLTSLGYPVTEKVLVDAEPDRKTEMIERTGRTTVPQIFVGETHVGGFDDLSQWVKDGRFAALVAQQPK